MTTKFDIAFVLDDSGSISSSDFTKMRDECKQLSDRFTENDRLALFMFASSVSKLTSFTDKDTFAECLSSYRRTNGMTALYSGINSATTEFKNYSTDASRIMIVVTDGYNNQSGASSATVINNAIEENVIIYCVGVGSVNSTVLKNISESTGGCYYYINQFSQLNGIFENIISETDLYKDSDGDGLSDYHEKMIAAGKMHTGSGEALRLCTTMNYLSSDSDGDGLADSEEVEIRKIPNSENYYCYMVSNPCVVDTDCDSYNDYVEEYIGSSPVSDVGIAVAAETGIHEQLVDVAQTHALLVNVVFALAGAVIPARDHQLVGVIMQGAVAVVQHERRLGKADGGALLRAAENDILHLLAAQRAGILLAHDPADGI